jgi:hypothetical protein
MFNMSKTILILNYILWRLLFMFALSCFCLVVDLGQMGIIFTFWFWQMSINHNPMIKRTYIIFFLISTVHKSGKNVLWMVYLDLPLYLS